MSLSSPNKARKARAGHQEIQGETIAKFELFDAGWNPYSRYLDEDKVDFILRRRKDANIIYREVQVKFGRLYQCTLKWELPLFDVTSWRFFKEDDFALADDRLFICYVLAEPGEGYRGDLFIFPVQIFRDLIRRSIRTETKRGVQYRMYISRSVDDGKWYLRKKSGFDTLSAHTVVPLQKFRRNFDALANS